ncbi:hypothetical protein CB0940_07767 [Cercospora beticola]|uniref:Uncharacterized protein n=1 Tax=Cercospora beticola TaxID=122368 RepID=A0A2G5H9Y6_CERBT|nr:hypothetical protein CB0940_07767 [Cercospora beticola]PIA89344.1 hypothetical protein CB0940_07767 [Cercospora beticola]WPB03736.1 hypothetical protein RHO25_008380 [Cercospora beticola]
MRLNSPASSIWWPKHRASFGDLLQTSKRHSRLLAAHQWHDRGGTAERSVEGQLTAASFLSVPASSSSGIPHSVPHARVAMKLSNTLL